MLKNCCVSTQIKLSEAGRVSLSLPVGGENGEGVEVVLTRQHLEKLSAPLFKRMGKAVDEACWQVRCIGFFGITNPSRAAFHMIVKFFALFVLLAMWMMSKYGLLSSDGT